MPLNLNTKSVYYKDNNKFIPIGKFDYSTYNPTSMGISGANAGDALAIGATEQGKPTTYEAQRYMYNMEIAVRDGAVGAIINGVGVTVYYNEYGPIYFQAVQQNNLPLEVSIPTGFTYYIEIYDPDELCAQVAEPITGIITDHDETFILTCGSEPTINTAQDIKNALNNDIDLTDLVGESITCSWRDTTLEWDVVDYSNDIITLMTHYLVTGPKYNEYDRAMYFENGLAVGKYYFKTGNASNAYLFTLTKAIPAGGQLNLGSGDLFYTYASQDSTSYIERGSITIVGSSSSALSDATDLGLTGANNLNHYYRPFRGNNNYGESAVFQWLNSDAENFTFSAVTKLQSDNQSISGLRGFLNGLDPDFIEVLDDTEWFCNANNTYECPTTLDGICQSTGEQYAVTAKVGLASGKEVNSSYSGIDDGSTLFTLFEDAPGTYRTKYTDSSLTRSESWCLRTPVANNPYSVMTANTNMSNVYCNSNDAIYYAPVVKISKTIK